MLQLLSFSIVIVAEHHNPTILNPDFLARNEIVPDNWGWERSEDCWSTPPLAQVKYKNDVAIICEHAKLQVVDRSDEVDPARSRIDEVAVKYLRTLPHVRYTSLGVNFKGIVPGEQPSQTLIERFLKPGPRQSASGGLDDLGLRLVYSRGRGPLRITLEAGEVKASEHHDGPVPAVIAGANFHHDLDENDRVGQIANRVNNKTEYWNQFRTILAQIMEYERSPSP